MALQIDRTGFGQVEPNHLSAQRTGQIYAQLPAKSDINILENGQFVKYNYSANEVDTTGKGEWMLVFNEVKLYDGLRETYKDFALKKTDYIDGVMTPRVFKTNVGDIFTTNMVKTGVEYHVGDVLTPVKNSTTNTLQLEVGTGNIEFVVAKVYTMPDGQDGLKLQRIK